jgi:tRNA nucleotidyltransferase/poly(A) polymerase
MSSKGKVNGFNLIKGVSYTVALSCCNISSLHKYLFEDSHSIDYSFSAAVAFLKNKQKEKFAVESNSIGQTEAKQLLIKRDVGKILKKLHEYRFFLPIEEELAKYEAFAKRFFKKYDIDLSNIPIRIVDEFPAPYSSVQASAMNFDIFDQEEFNIPMGISLHREYLAPFVSAAKVSHELVHSCFSNTYSHYLARGLEEGFCDLISFILTAKMFGFKVSVNLMLNSRFIYPQTQFLTTYVEAIRQVSIVYRQVGLGGMMDILRKGNRKGRVIMKELEEAIFTGWEGKLAGEFVRKGDRNPNVLRFLDFFIAYPYSLVVSPLAYFLAEKITVGASISEIIQTNRIDPFEGEEAVKELQQRVFLVLTEGDRIISDETKLFLKLNLLRYEI